MKKILVLILMALMLPACVEAQGAKKGKKEVSPVIEGKQKVRKTDYDTIWKYTSFDGKKLYYMPFDYTQIPEIVVQRKNKLDWKNFTPVMNYLTRVSRAPMRICAVFAINPQITDPEQIAALVKAARTEAVGSLQTLVDWMLEKEMKNKVQINVAQLDFRYWQGNEYFYNEQPTDDVIRMGIILYFGSKKIQLFTSAAENAPTYNDVKFFPNDATIPESYGTMLDEVAQYMSQNDRLEVLLRGYSDNTGTSAYNNGLARQRAVEVKKALLKRGISEHRIEIEVKGAEDPIGDNNTYEGRIANNRVSVTLQ